MQFKLLTILLLTTLTLAAPLPAPQLISSPGNNGSSPSGIITRLNNFIYRFSTRPGVLAVGDSGLTPDTVSPVTQLEVGGADLVPVVDNGADIVPVVVEESELAQPETGNVLQLKKAPVVDTAPVEVSKDEFEVVPAAVTV